MAREERGTATDERRRRPRLDQPRLPRRRFSPFANYDPESFGRFSERIARFIGTGRFLVYMTLVIIVWVVWNIFAPPDLRWDEYPFIFLTLALSLQASYAAPLILLAQNRQADRDRVQYEQDKGQNERSVADAEYLTDPDPDGWLRLSVRLDWPEEAPRRLLAAGRWVEVLEPAEVRARLADTARAIAARYASDPG